MKRIISSILASTLCFTGSLPVFAGSNPVSNSGFEGTTGSGANGNGDFNNMSRTKVFINLRGQRQILLELNQVSLPILNPLAQNNRNIQSLIILLTGNKGQANSEAPIQAARVNLISTLIALGLDVSDSARPATQLVNALTLMIPFGSNATPSETIGVAAVDGTKLYQAITAYNQLINQLSDTANGTGADAARARAILQALREDETFDAVSSTLRSLREKLETSSADNEDKKDEEDKKDNEDN